MRQIEDLLQRCTVKLSITIRDLMSAHTFGDTRTAALQRTITP